MPTDPWNARSAPSAFSPAIRPYEEWKLADPAGWTLDGVRPVRDEIEERVRHLLNELGVPAHG